MTVPGLISILSVDGYASTVARLDAALVEHRITPVLRLDHAAAAASVGLSLSPVLLVVFGDPKVGTALMQQSPTAGLDLPLKLLVWEVDGGSVRVGYNDPAWIATRHDLKQRSSAAVGMATLLRDLAQRAAAVIRS